MIEGTNRCNKALLDRTEISLSISQACFIHRQITIEALVHIRLDLSRGHLKKAGPQGSSHIDFFQY